MTNDVENSKDELNDHIDSLNEVVDDYDQFFDSKLVYIGCGVMALSLTLVPSYGLDTRVWYRCTFVVGLVLVAIYVAAHLTAPLVFKDQIRKRQDTCGDKILNPEVTHIKSVDEWERAFRRSVARTNWTLLVLLLSGSALLVITLVVTLLSR